MFVKEVDLNKSDIKFITKLKSLHSLVLTDAITDTFEYLISLFSFLPERPAQILFQSPWPNLTSLTVDPEIIRALVPAVNENKLLNLVDLKILANKF